RCRMHFLSRKPNSHILYSLLSFFSLCVALPLLPSLLLSLCVTLYLSLYVVLSLSLSVTLSLSPLLSSERCLWLCPDLVPSQRVLRLAGSLRLEGLLSL